jgi:hypothetical protein
VHDYDIAHLHIQLVASFSVGLTYYNI